MRIKNNVRLITRVYMQVTKQPSQMGVSLPQHTSHLALGETSTSISGC